MLRFQLFLEIIAHPSNPSWRRPTARQGNVKNLSFTCERPVSATTDSPGLTNSLKVKRRIVAVADLNKARLAHLVRGGILPEAAVCVGAQHAPLDDTDGPGACSGDILQ